MSERKFIPAQRLFDEWRKDPEFMREYDALEEEFALAGALIGARAEATLPRKNSPNAWAPAKAPSTGWKAAGSALDADVAETGGGNGDEAADYAGAEKAA